MTKPTLRDRRRTEAREALYRAEGRRDKLIDALVRNNNHIKRLTRALVRLGTLDPRVVSKTPLSVAEGKLLDELPPLSSFTSQLNDDIPDLSGGRR